MYQNILYVYTNKTYNGNKTSNRLTPSAIIIIENHCTVPSND